METGAITNQIDVAQLVLYAFWIFFFGLILYLRREDKREGYPLASDRSGRVKVQGFPRIPSPKTFRLDDGTMRYAPRAEAPEPEPRAVPAARWPGAPLVPTGDALRDSVGPGASALRADVADLTLEGEARIVPMRVAKEFSVERRDAELRGMTVVGADGAAAGEIADLWVDRVEPQIRYVEVRTQTGRAVLIPVHYLRIDSTRHTVHVKAVLAKQLANAPALASADRITMREEDRISAYYAGGLLYAEPGRAEPFL